MNKLVIVIQLVFLTSIGNGQIVSFSDIQLKHFLINEKCIDVDYDGFVDIDADFNNDNEIQTMEADSISNLHIGYVNDNYYIKSIQDLSQFPNLKFLKLNHNDSLFQISDLGLSKLHTLRIDAEFRLRIVDVSDLDKLTDLRIEGCDTLYDLNIQNGSVADYFSLFYSENILYACVDSIAKEYNEVAWRMISGTPSIDCLTAIEEEVERNQTITVFPNPTSDILTVISPFEVEKIRLFNIMGMLVCELKNNNNRFDISWLNNGVYIIEIHLRDQIFINKVCKN